MLLLGSWVGAGHGGGLAGQLSINRLWGSAFCSRGAWGAQRGVGRARVLCRRPACAWGHVALQSPGPCGGKVSAGLRRGGGGGGGWGVGMACTVWAGAAVAPPTPTPCPSVGLSVLPLSLCVCLLSSVLPSLSAPHLVSSSLTCWQDEVPRLPPGARSPRSAPGTAGGGVARCCLASWSSEQVDRHPPLVAPGVTVGCRLLPRWGESPLPVWASRGCWWSGVSGLEGCVKPGLPSAHGGQSGISCVLGAAPPRTHAGS